MTKKPGWYHIVFWIALYLFWILVFQKRAFAFSKTITVEFCYLLFIAANYYFNIYFAVPRFLYTKKYGTFTALFLAGIITAALLRVPLATYLSLHFFAPGKTPPGFYELFLNSFTNIFIWVICLVAGKIIIDRIRFQKYVDLVEQDKVKNELDFLKAQFNPHFLFNSINSIYGNIDKGNSSARNMLLTFSDMLRYQLYECNTDSISIDREVNYIRNYVALQQTRNAENLVVDLELADDLKGFTVAPLLFTAFIENAFKYVSHHEHKENRVEISLSRKVDSLIFRAFNTKEKNYNGQVALSHGGIGIANVKRRLELLYPYKHELAMNRNDTSYEVLLKLQV
ncbi:MAG TPA: histidine kinase [Chitinophagaceae bacterium]|nr:histidine kinase [Chitinophagaceae bacterium]